MKPKIKWIFPSAVLFMLVSCLSFFYFSRVQQQASVHTPKPSDWLLPETRLIDSTGVVADDQTLRKGKVILVFLSTNCKPCDNELDFLRQVFKKREDVKFYGIVSFGPKDSLKETEEKFPFKTYLDEGGLAHRLRIARVPMKVLVKDGHIQEIWGGSSERTQAEFIKWLEGVD
jgi:peroxiredoxin